MRRERVFVVGLAMRGEMGSGERLTEKEACLRWDRAPLACDERCDVGRDQVVSIASDCWRGEMSPKRDCRRDRQSVLMSVAPKRRCLARGHSPLWGRSATNLMVPPHSGQGGGSTPIFCPARAAGSSFPCAVGSTWIDRSERQRASFSVRWPLARNPKCRMRCKPSGNTWSRKRRMNSSGFNLKVLTAPPSR